MVAAAQRVASATAPAAPMSASLQSKPSLTAVTTVVAERRGRVDLASSRLGYATPYEGATPKIASALRSPSTE
jgi:hypothetical protein